MVMSLALPVLWARTIHEQSPVMGKYKLRGAAPSRKVWDGRAFWLLEGRRNDKVVENDSRRCRKDEKKVAQVRAVAAFRGHSEPKQLRHKPGKGVAFLLPSPLGGEGLFRLPSPLRGEGLGV